MSIDPERLRQQASDGDRDAWRSLAKHCAEHNEPLELQLLVAPWATRDDVLEACAEALIEGCTLVAGRFIVRPYRGDLSRGAECLSDEKTRERWWGGLGAENSASSWLYEQWFQHEQESTLGAL